MTTRIGLEVHVPLATRAKLFCPCPAEGEGPNRHICPTCTGQPGARPQGVNGRALVLAVATAHLLGASRRDETAFQRKHYWYPDLPSGYQRTSTPVGEEGRFWDVGILECHLEEDPGAYDPSTGLVDLDRSGTPLLEIVTAPDLGSPEEVATWLRVLRVSLARAGILRPGAELKADVNVSVEDGPRTEVKNVVGGRNAAKAAAYEIERQHGVLEGGGTNRQETRHFDEARSVTKGSREKESVGDYRYQLDPDLLPLDLAAIEAAAELTALEDVPAKVRALQGELALDLGEALALLEDADLDALFTTLRTATEAAMAVEVALRRLRSELEYRDTTLAAAGISPEAVVALARAWHGGAITKQVFTRLLRAGLDGEDVIALLARERNADALDLEAVAAEVLTANTKAVEDYRRGREGALHFLVGQVMARTKGRARPDEARRVLEEALLEA